MTKPAGWVLLHTTDVVGMVGVAQGGTVDVEFLDTHSQHARTLLGALERLLARSERSLEELGGIVVTIGPGSFTGIRIGLATAHGLAAARGWKVWACNSLLAEAVALHVEQGVRGAIAAIQDARRGEVYAALYDVEAAFERAASNWAAPDAGRAQNDASARTEAAATNREQAPGLRTLAAPFCAAPRAAAGEIGREVTRAAADACGRVAVAVGVGTGAQLVAAAAPDCLAAVHARPSAEAYARALFELARTGHCTCVAPEHLEPAYLRKSDAELKREQRR